MRCTNSSTLPVAPGHRRGGRRRVEALGHDPCLLLVRPATSPADAGNDFDPAELVGLRTGRTTMITHRSRAHSNPLGPFILILVSRSARCPSDDVYGEG